MCLTCTCTYSRDAIWRMMPRAVYIDACTSRVTDLCHEPHDRRHVESHIRPTWNILMISVSLLYSSKLFLLWSIIAVIKFCFHLQYNQCVVVQLICYQPRGRLMGVGGRHISLRESLTCSCLLNQHYRATKRAWILCVSSVYRHVQPLHMGVLEVHAFFAEN